MRIQRLEVANFRSIKTASLPDIGDFNVLIGQNNSGKSNLLSCVSIFFRCIASKSVVIDTMDFGNELDFHKRDLDLPIDIRMIFSLLPAERDVLLGDVISEVPEMRRAVEGLDPSLLLSLTVRARHRNADGPLVYVREAAFVRLNGPKEDGSRIILQISSEAASELQSRKHVSHRLRKRASALQTFLDRVDADDWARFSRRGERESPGPPLSYYLREFVGLTGDMLEEIRSLVIKSTSYQEFQNSALSQINEIQTEADAREGSPLANKISTITGEVAEVPIYVNRLLERVAGVGVLHLRERRKDIGAEEAERLLRLKVSRGGPEVLRGIQEIVQSLLGVQVDAFSAEPAERDADRIDRRRPPSRPRAELDVETFLLKQMELASVRP